MVPDGLQVVPRCSKTGVKSNPRWAQVLPVGGIKEKLLAARRAGIKEIVLCESNQKHVEEIQARYLKGLRFHYVKNMTDVIDRALLKETVDSPLKITAG